MGFIHRFTAKFSLILLFFSIVEPSFSVLVKDQPLILKYHNGPLLKGNITVDLIWYGKFNPTQRSVVVDFIQSLNFGNTPQPSVYSWWGTIDKYKGGPSIVAVGKQFLDENYSMGKSLKNPQITRLASKSDKVGSITVLLTANDVAVEGFCMNRCGTHGSTTEKTRVVYAWVGNPDSQCPGQCAWPFHQPMYGPQTPPLVAPNGDVGIDGMIINIATVFAGAVTNPFNTGYYQGSVTAPEEAVSACTGIFGSSAYPGYPGNVLVDKTTGASYNANGVNGRKFLLPAMWDPETSACKTLV